MTKIKLIAALALAGCLGGCASIPLATGLSIASVGIAAGALAINAYHDCRADGGCKTPLPK